MEPAERQVEPKKSHLIYCVAIAEFDITSGVILSHVYPNSRLDAFERSNLAALCIPDGGHKVKSDWTYIILKEPKPLFGLSFFRNVPDPSQPRGARQMSMVLLLTKPFFLLFKPIVQEALFRFMDFHEVDAPRVVYQTICTGLHRAVQFSLFDKHFILNIPSLDKDPFPGASLATLVRVFKTDLYWLWLALLLGCRVLFSGSSGEVVGNGVLAAPLLSLPLAPPVNITPFVSLTDMTPLDKPAFLCGSSNPMLKLHHQAYDLLCDYDERKISFAPHYLTAHPDLRPSAKFKTLVRRVLKNVDCRGEKWARQKFRLFTARFLQRCLNDTLGLRKKTLFCTLRMSERLKMHKEELEAAAKRDVNPALCAFRVLQEAQDDEDNVTAVQLMKLYYALDQALFEVSDVEKLVELSAVSVVAQGLESSSSQVRKYAINLLAKLAVSVPAQVDLVETHALEGVVSCLHDKLPFVVSAAVMCLQKTASLHLGALAIVERKLTTELAKLVLHTSKETHVRYCAAVALLQVYRFFPSAAPPTVSLDMFAALLTEFSSSLATPSKSPDISLFRTMSEVVTELLDIWGHCIPFRQLKGFEFLAEQRSSPHKLLTIAEAKEAKTAELTLELNPKLFALLQVLSKCESERAVTALEELSSLIATNTALQVQCAHVHTVHFLKECGWLHDPNTFRAWEVIARLSRTQCGSHHIAKGEVLALALQTVTAADAPSFHLLFVLCFLEAVVQLPEVANQLFTLGAGGILTDFLLTHFPVQRLPHAEKENEEEEEEGSPAEERAGAPAPPVKTTTEENRPPLTVIEEDFLFVCLPAVRTLKYLYARVDLHRRKLLREGFSRLSFILDLDVDPSQCVEADFQTILVSLLVVLGALHPSYLDWIARVREHALQATQQKEMKLQMDLAEPRPSKQQDVAPVVKPSWTQRVLHKIGLKPMTQPANPLPHRPSLLFSKQFVRQGWLMKKNHRNRRWVRRWVVLTNDTLIYFRTQQSTRASQVLPLRDVSLARHYFVEDEMPSPDELGELTKHVTVTTVAKKKPKYRAVFAICTAGKSYLFRALNCQEMLTWARALLTVAVNLKLDNQAPEEEEEVEEVPIEEEKEETPSSIFHGAKRSQTLRRVGRQSIPDAAASPRRDSLPSASVGHVRKRTISERLNLLDRPSARRVSMFNQRLMNSRSLRRVSVGNRVMKKRARQPSWPFPQPGEIE